MAKRTLEFQGSFDSSQIERQTQKLSKTIERAFGKDGISMIDKQSQAFLKTEANSSIRSLSAEVKKLTAEAKRYDDALKSSKVGTEEQNTLNKKRLEITEEIVRRERQIASIQKAQSRIQDTGEEALRGAATALDRGTGTGAMLGGGRGLAFGGLATVVAGATLAISRMSNAAQTYSQQVPRFLRLSAMGQARAGGAARGTAEQLGFTAQETFGVQEGITRALGAASQGETESRVANVLTAARGLAVDPNQITGMADRLRAVGGTQAAEGQLTRVLSTAISSGMDKSQATHFLDATTSLLTEINEGGIMATDSIIRAMATLTTEKGMAPEQAKQLIGGINQAIKGSTGESQTFFRMAAARGGLGAGSIFGTGQAVRQGLLGVNLDRLTQGMGTGMAGRARSAFQEFGLTGSDYTRRFAGGIIDQLGAIQPDTGTNADLLTRGSILSQFLDLGSAAEGVKVLDVLEKISKGQGELTKAQKETLEDIGKDPEKEWRDKVAGYLNDVARNTASLGARRTFIQTDLGEESQKQFNKLTAVLNKVDKTLEQLLKGEASGVGQTTIDLGGSIQKLFEPAFEPLAEAIYYGIEGLTETVQDFWERVNNRVRDFLFGDDTFLGKTLSLFTGKGVAEGQDKALARQGWFKKEAGNFEKAAGFQLDTSASEEYRALLESFRQTGTISQKQLTAFNKQQTTGDEQVGMREAMMEGANAGGFDMSEMLEVLRQVARNTGETAKKQRKTIPSQRTESPAPNM